MKQRLAAGAELDVLTPAEAQDLLADAFREVATRRIRAEATGATTAAGGLTLDSVYTVPPGMEFELRRLLVECDNATPGAKFVAAAGWIDIFRAQNRADFYELSNGVPGKLSYGQEQGPIFRNGEQLGIVVVGGPASVNMQFKVQGILERLPAGRGGD